MRDLSKPLAETFPTRKQRVQKRTAVRGATASNKGKAAKATRIYERGDKKIARIDKRSAAKSTRLEAKNSSMRTAKKAVKKAVRKVTKDAKKSIKTVSKAGYDTKARVSPMKKKTVKKVASMKPGFKDKNGMSDKDHNHAYKRHSKKWGKDFMGAGMTPSEGVRYRSKKIKK